MAEALSSAVPPGRPGVPSPSYRDLSLWFDTLPGEVVARPALAADLEVDIAIVGGGFTGLWTAHALKSAQPGLRIAVLEREVAGFSASGRNGGWYSALFPVSFGALAREHGLDQATALRLALQGSVDEVGRTAAAEGIDCHFHKGGTLALLRNRAQLVRAQAEVAEARNLNIGPEDLALLRPEEATERLAASRVLGATYTPHCAALHPGRLVRGLAAAVARRGVALYEHTPVTGLAPGAVTTPGGRVRAEVVVLATEGYGTDLAGQRRRLAPVYSLMVATEPLAADVRAEIGLAERETFSDHRHLVIYGQATGDGRLAFGGRGAPYHFASAVRPAFDRSPAVHAALEATLTELLPALRSVVFSHRWGGALGIPRDWHPSVGFDRRQGLAWAGGYVGDGVAATNLAGRTLAALILGADDPLVRLPWVGHRSRDWEVEPFRWLGVNAGLAVMASADRVEERTGRPARRAALFGRLLGG